jgi:DNA repair exonuclease SbcCD ATPase subunit
MRAWSAEGWLGGLAVWALLWAVPGQPRADESAYCRKVKAQADEQAALLSWPNVTLSGARYPSAGGGLGPTFGDNLQARIGVSYSVTGLFQASHLGDAAEIDCDLQDAWQALHDRIHEADGDASLPALQAQVAFLDGRRQTWRDLLKRANDQLAAGVATALETEELRRSVATLERRLESIRGDKERLEARPPAPPPPAISALSEKVVRRTAELAAEQARAKAFDAFQLKLTAGVIPDFVGQGVYWFGQVELSYNLGRIAQARAATRWVDAQAEEMKQARYELPTQAAGSQRDLRARLGQARRELRVVQDDMESIRSLRTALERSSASRADQVHSALIVEELWVESDRIYLETLIQALARITEETPARS